MARTSNSIILREAITNEALVEKLEICLRGFKNQFELFFLYEGSTNPSPEVIFHSWWEPMNPEMDITLVIDDKLDSRYINVTNSNSEQRRQMLDELIKHFDVVTLSELQDTVQRNSETNNWIRLALGNREEFNSISFKLIFDGLQSSNKTERYGAAQATAIIQWPQFTDALHTSLEKETDFAVKEVIKVALQVCSASP